MTKDQWRKNNGALKHMSNRLQNCYWQNACSNRWLKRADDIGEGILKDLMLFYIYHYPKWWIEGYRDGNLTEVIKERNSKK